MYNKIFKKTVVYILYGKCIVKNVILYFNISLCGLQTCTMFMYVYIILPNNTIQSGQINT